MPKGRPKPPPDEQAAAREAAIIDAERALARGEFDTARRCLSDAERLGATARDVRSLRQSIIRAEKALPARIRRSFWIGFLISALGYALLAFRQPLQWTTAVWAALAFLVIPLISGFVAGRAQGLATHARDRFRASCFGAAWPMFWYTLITLIVLRARLESGPDAGQLFLIVMFVSILYAAAAGLVAGIAGSRLAPLSAGRRRA